MRSPVPTTPLRRVGVAVAALGVVLVILSPLFGRAPVTGQYRPLVPADGLTTGCYPLPGGVVPDFAYVLRRDGDTVAGEGIRRRAVLQYDRVDAAGATATIQAQFEAAGVADDVRVEARDFEAVSDDAIVRGEMVLDLPAVEVQSDDPVCQDANSTKRFTPDLPDRS
jgi:hypothetical protein